MDKISARVKPEIDNIAGAAAPKSMMMKNLGRAGKTVKFVGGMAPFILPSLAMTGEGFGDSMKEYERRTGISNRDIVDPTKVYE